MFLRLETTCVILVASYSSDARTTLRNVCRAHEETVVRQFGRAALLAETRFGAFLACRLRQKHGTAVQVEQTDPFLARVVAPAAREAAVAYERREEPATPYRAFAANRDLPSPTDLRGERL